MTEILVTSSVLIVVIALLRLVLRGKISQRVQYALCRQRAQTALHDLTSAFVVAFWKRGEEVP